MLACNQIHDFDVLFFTARQNREVIVLQTLLDDLDAALFRFLDKQFGFNGGQFFFVVADKESAGQFIVLGLRQQIDGNPFVVRRFVDDYDDFGWSGDRIDADISVHQFFGQSDVLVPGSDDFVDARNGFRTVSQGSHGLGAAHLINVGHAADIASGQSCLVDGGLLRWGHDDRFLYAGYIGQNGSHQNCGRIARFTARHIDADFVQRMDLLVQFPCRRLLPFDAFLVDCDVVAGLLQSSAQDRIQAVISFLDDALRHFQFRDVRPIETFCVFEQRSVAFFLNRLDDFHDSLRLRKVDCIFCFVYFLERFSCVHYSSPSID